MMHTRIFAMSEDTTARVEVLFLLMGAIKLSINAIIDAYHLQMSLFVQDHMFRIKLIWHTQCRSFKLRVHKPIRFASSRRQRGRVYIWTVLSPSLLLCGYHVGFPHTFHCCCCYRCSLSFSPSIALSLSHSVSVWLGSSAVGERAEGRQGGQAVWI